MIAYVLPTRGRPEHLARTLGRLAALPRHDAEIIIVDNAGDPPARAPIELSNGLPIRVLMRTRNEAAAGRNAGVLAADPAASWIVMLDDDSAPLDLGFLDALRQQPAAVAAVAAEIFLPGTPDGRSRRESGGLPEVFIGCGVAIRRGAWEASADDRARLPAGYDPSFEYYAEEYDLSARLIRSGGRIVLDRRFRVLHEKTTLGRDMDAILRRLVRNNAWVMRRYAPQMETARETRRTITRYGRIALKERAELGYMHGLGELALTLHRQPRTPLSHEHWDRFIGLAACRDALAAAITPGERAAIIAPGKNAHVIAQALRERGTLIVTNERDADVLVLGTLSPGPMLDLLDAHAASHAPGKPRIVAPTTIAPSCSAASNTRIALIAA